MLQLNINNPQTSSRGTYKCTAKNKVGSVSKDISLSVTKVPKVQLIMTDSNNDELQELLLYTFKCHVTDNDENPEIIWLDNERKVLQTVSEQKLKDKEMTF